MWFISIVLPVGCQIIDPTYQCMAAKAPNLKRVQTLRLRSGQIPLSAPASNAIETQRAQLRLLV
jgi:hypothetical protein